MARRRTFKQRLWAWMQFSMLGQIVTSVGMFVGLFAVSLACLYVIVLVVALAVKTAAVL